MSLEPNKFNQNNVYSLVETNNSTPELSQATDVNSEELVAHPMIKCWLYWLGADVVSRWRTLPIEQESLSTIFQELNPELSCANSPLLIALAQSKMEHGSIVTQLELEYKESHKQQFKYFTNSLVLKSLIPLTASLVDFLTKRTQKCLDQLEDNVDNLRATIHKKLHLYFYLLRAGGTKTAFASIDCLSQKLQDLAKKYEWQWQEYSYKSNASKHSFENLSAQITQWWQVSKQQKADSLLNALKLTYKFQLEGQLCLAAYQLLKELDTQIQEHILILSEVDLWQAQLQSWFVQQYPLDPVPADFLKQYLSPRINASQFLEEIEQWTGISRYQWVSLDQNELSCLKSEILLQLQPTCFEFYTECFQVNKKLSNNDLLKNSDK